MSTSEEYKDLTLKRALTYQREAAWFYLRAITGLQAGDLSLASRCQDFARHTSRAARECYDALTTNSEGAHNA